MQYMILDQALNKEKKIATKDTKRVPTVAQQVTNPTSSHEDMDSIPGPAQWVKDLATL